MRALALARGGPREILRKLRMTASEPGGRYGEPGPGRCEQPNSLDPIFRTAQSDGNARGPRDILNFVEGDGRAKAEARP